jgi:transcriptional regulator GlxA family with amidase domain
VVLGICSGNSLVADTGLAAGYKATANTGTFSYVEAHSPTTWLRNLRLVDDGNIVTSSNLTSGIEATLHIVRSFAGRAKALAVARQIGFTHTSTLDDPCFEPTTDRMLQIGINAGLEWPQKQQLGVLMYHGVTELGMSGVVDPLEVSASARTFFMSPERRIVLSRNGL